MDKYFSPTYDPRLDYTLTDVTDPSTGLIAEGAFDGWDRMLETVRARKEDKSNSNRATREGREEREKSERRKERERRRAEREERRRKRKRRKGGDAASDEEDSHDGASDNDGDRSSYGASRGGGGVMDVKYVKRGKAREWDLGKETPT
jgi:hypothetical protein